MKRALVTGSFRGFGRAIAVSLAKDGYEVIVHCAGNRQKAEETKEMGEVDALVLNASLLIRRLWCEITVEECRKQMNCNYVASMLLIQAAVPHMKQQKWGRIAPAW